MNKTRLEAFSDGLLAIIITIMVLEMKVPMGSSLHSLQPLIPTFISYFLSFLNIGIYWGNHHHLLHTVKKVTAGIMLANLNLLFWLSLVPFATGWMGENNFEATTVAVYATLLLICGFAYYVLQGMIVKHNDFKQTLKAALKKQKRKGIISQINYLAAIPLAFANPLLSAALILLTAIMWLIPDKNIERAFAEQ